jgi:hypothetical protein
LTTDITNAKQLYVKAALLLGAGMVASGLLIVRHPAVETIVLLALAVWCFARAYYFAFYVIEHYVDPGYRFAGLASFIRYALGKRPPEQGRCEG